MATVDLSKIANNMVRSVASGEVRHKIPIYSHLRVLLIS